MEYFDWKNEINNKELKKCIDAIKSDEIVIFPTETVYGIGANALSEKAVKKIYEAKGRNNDNPLIVHVSDIDMLNEVAENINEIEKKLIKEFMPGPFTLILKKKKIIPNVVSANLDTIGIRMPKNIIAQMLIKESNLPIAAPSANISGKPSGTNCLDIKDELLGKAYALIDGGESEIGLESTVVKVIEDKVMILRPGKITLEEIKKVIPKVEYSKNIFKQVGKNIEVESPGMKYKHYAPDTKCVLIYRENEEEQINEVQKLIEENVCILGFNEHKNVFKDVKFISLGSMYNLEEVSKNLFKNLREIDKIKCKLAIIEGVKKEGIGVAIMNRLIRACI